MMSNKSAGILLLLPLLCFCNKGPGTRTDLDSSTNPDPVPIPTFRLGPRSSMGVGFYGPYKFKGTISVPVGTKGFVDFSSFEVMGHGGSGTVDTVSAPRQEGGMWVSDLTVSVNTYADVPAQSREILTAVSADKSIVLTAVLTKNNKINFSPGSTARQVLSLAGVCSDSRALEEVYYFGVRKGDDPKIDRAVPAVESAITSLLTAHGSSGIYNTGFAVSDTAVFDAVDNSVGAPGVDPPVVAAPATFASLGTVRLPANVTQVAIWMGGQVLPQMVLPQDTTALGFFFYSLGAGPETPMYVRARLSDGTQTRASPVFHVPRAANDLPDSPTVTLVTGGAQACGSRGHWILFLNSSTELALGFEALKAEDADGCVFVPSQSYPPDTSLLSAVQITKGLLVSPAGNIVFP